MPQTTMKVQLANITPNPIESIYKGFRVCYSAKSPTEIKIPLLEDGTPNNEKMINFIKPLIKANHLSPLEHVSFTFHIEGVSRSLLAQLTRHRTAKFNVKSQRYVGENEFDYVIPADIENDEIARELFIKSMEEQQIKYNEIANRLLDKYMRHEEIIRWDLPCSPPNDYFTQFWASKKGKQIKGKLKKKAYENSRAVLPNSCATNLIMTIDARNFRNLYAQRSCQHAQAEIRELAKLMNKLVKEHIPFIDFGAKWCGVFCNECSDK